MNPLENISIYLLSALLIAITSVVYSYILTQPGEIFGWLFGKLNEFFKTDERTSQGLGPHPLFKMIMWCEKCVSGQMSLWLFLIINWKYYAEGVFIIVIPHAFFVTLSIFLSLTIKKIYNKHIE